MQMMQKVTLPSKVTTGIIGGESDSPSLTSGEKLDDTTFYNNNLAYTKVE